MQQKWYIVTYPWILIYPYLMWRERKAMNNATWTGKRIQNSSYTFQFVCLNVISQMFYLQGFKQKLPHVTKHRGTSSFSYRSKIIISSFPGFLYFVWHLPKIIQMTQVTDTRNKPTHPVVMPAAGAWSSESWKLWIQLNGLKKDTSFLLGIAVFDVWFEV